MAIKFSDHEVFTTRERHSDDREHRTWRLAHHHIEDLQDVARGVEETNAGVCCKYLIDQRSGIGADYDETVLDAVENFSERYGVGLEWRKADPTLLTWFRRIERCRRAFAKMYGAFEHKHVAVLHIVYGYPDPSIRTLPQTFIDSLQELASLAKYTNTVEVYRQEMARQEGMRRSQKYSNKEQSKEEIHADAFRHNMSPDHFAPIIDIIHTRDRIHWADMAISSGDALRSMFATLKERDPIESKEHYQVRKDNADVRRDTLTFQIKSEAKEMHKVASKKYHNAWLKSANV